MVLNIVVTIKFGTISPPFISPNPVGPAGRVNITANQAESGKDIKSMMSTFMDLI